MSALFTFQAHTGGHTGPPLHNVKNQTLSTTSKTPLPTITPSRLAAFEILRRVEQDNAFASVLLATQVEDLQPNDRALCHELVMGVLRQELWLDRLIAHYAARDPERLDLEVRIALRLGLYQLRFLSKIPASAAVNESVNLVRRARLRSAEPFVNAVLRRATRELSYDPAAEIAEPVERLAVETSHPLWLIKRWVNTWGFDHTTAFARANNEASPTAFRIVNESVNQTEVFAAFQSAGVELRPSTITPGAWRITGAAGVPQKLAREGRIYVQDEASQLVAHVVGAKPGDCVLDVCAAPGSKTTHIADLQHNVLFVVAGDLHHHRLRAVVETATEHRLANIQCVALDARQTLPFCEASFDRVLVDAPCTGTGTLRRNPEIRKRITPADIEDLADRQNRILQQSARMVKPGGRLIYSTCSIEPEENEHIINGFTEQTAGFVQLTLPVNSSLTTNSGAARLWPHRDGSDGFFIVAFQRL